MLFKVVIIDDNVSTVNSLQVSIDWASMGLEIAGTALNGIQGCELIKRVKPDIVITDINMPDMDGLHMIESINMEGKEIRVIIITGYDKFQYASRAIKLSVFDFILKPIDDQELCGSLIRARQSLENKLYQNKQLDQIKLNNLKVRILSFLTTPMPDLDIENSGGENGEFNKEYFIIIAHSISGVFRPLLERLSYEQFPENVMVISLVIEGYLVLFCILKQHDDNWKKYAQNIGAKLISHTADVNIAVSALHDSYKTSRQAFLEARKTLLGQDAINEKQKITYYEEGAVFHHIRIADMEKAVIQITGGDLNEEGYDKLYAVIINNTDGRIESIRIMLMIFCLRSLDYHLKKSQWSDSIDDLIYQISKITSIQKIKDWYFEFTKVINNAIEKESGLLKLIKDVLNYINLYAAEGVTLESTARQFNVSPNYLSSLIHKETGVTYQHHVIRAKINVAKQLLDDTRMTIEEIGYSIGYENYVSFYHAFKNVEGINPSDYRFRNNR
jgi:YesN/AraC family two-component response regulator